MYPRTFLDVLIEVGAVEERSDHVVLAARGYRPLAGSEDQLAYLSENVGDHLAASVNNVIGPGETYDMAVHYRGLSVEGIAQLEAKFRERMAETLQEMDKMARELPADQDGPHRFRAGGYFFDDRTGDDRP